MITREEVLFFSKKICLSDFGMSCFPGFILNHWTPYLRDSTLKWQERVAISPSVTVRDGGYCLTLSPLGVAVRPKDTAINTICYTRYCDNKKCKCVSKVRSEGLNWEFVAWGDESHMSCGSGQWKLWIIKKIILIVYQLKGHFILQLIACFKLTINQSH